MAEFAASVQTTFGASGPAVVQSVLEGVLAYHVLPGLVMYSAVAAFGGGAELASSLGPEPVPELAALCSTFVSTAVSR